VAKARSSRTRWRPPPSSQYEEDLAAYGHEISSNLYGYESKLFKYGAKRTMAMAPYGALIAGADRRCRNLHGQRRIVRVRLPASAAAAVTHVPPHRGGEVHESGR